MLKLDGKSIDFNVFCDAMHAVKRIECGQDVFERIKSAQQHVALLSKGEKPIYGMNTGLGANLTYRLKPDEIPEFQKVILRGRAVACGEPLPPEISRGALLARIISATTGLSGISLELFHHLCQFYQAGLAPIVPEFGSIGAGDLTQNASLALSVIGEGEVWNGQDRSKSNRVLEQLNISVPALGPKDAMVLINHSGMSVARAAHALKNAQMALQMIKCATVLSFEGYAANKTILERDLNNIRLAPGQTECAEWFSEMLSEAEYEPRRIQEALSFRTVASVFGAAQASLNNAIDVLEAELLGSSDSPVILEDGEMLSTANFHSPALALALENVALAVASVSNGSVQRVQKMMNPDLSGLPRYLSPLGQGAAGMVPVQKTAAALLAEIRRHAVPVAFDPAPVSDAVEDVAPMTSQSASKLDEQARSVKLLAGIEALVACQALDMREAKKCGKLTRNIWPAIRKVVPMLREDRPLSDDIHLAAKCLENQVL
ncbi:MAG: aromatic amino acid ammonia-lyase [Pseudomonadota bacterium]